MTPLPGRRRKSRESLELPLTSLIDVVSILVIFLVVNAGFSAADVVLPEGVLLPQSRAPQEALLARRLLISAGRVSLVGNDTGPTLALEQVGLTGDSDRSAFFKILREMPGPETLSIVADRRLPYGRIYPLLAALRDEGFHKVSLLSEGH